MSTFNYVPRVIQLDASSLDEEVVGLLKNQIFESTKLFKLNYLTQFDPEIEFLLRTIIFKSSLLKDGKTFGQQMLSLKYNERTFSKGKIYTSNRKAQNFINNIERIQVIGDFFNFLRFIQTGKNPTFIDYLLNLEVASEKVIRNQYTDYAWTRELLWHSFIELFGVISTFLSLYSVRRAIKEKLSSILRKKKTTEFSTFLNNTPIIKANTKCAECGSNPILPHFMGCEHIFCHYCLQAHKLENPHYSCPKCDFFSDIIMSVPTQ